MTSFGEKLRNWRESKGLSVNWVGEVTGIGRPNLISIEKGRRAAADDVLKKLAAVQELGLDYTILRLWKVSDEYPEFANLVQNMDIPIPNSATDQLKAVGLMKWVTATDLEHWSNMVSFPSLLPEVIKRLILASSSRLKFISFPSGESILQSGWDGFLCSQEGTLFISSGYSFWELSCRKDVGKKANDDYKKREQSSVKAAFPGAEYVYVTSRRWNNKNNWLHEKREAGVWNNVRVLDADDLELWLALCPSVGKWLAITMGKVSPDATSFEDFWERWSTLKGLNLTPDIVLLGREEQIEKIKNWLASKPNLIQIKGDTKDEALAFLVSVIYTLPSPEKEYWLSRSLIVNNDADLSSILGAQGPLIIALNNINQGAIDYLRGKGHYIFVPLSKEEKIEDNTYTLSRVSVFGLENQLKKAGIKEQEATRLARSTGRSLTVLRRLQGTQTAPPQWAKPECFSTMLPALLLGRWDETSTGDIRLIESLTNEPYREYSSKVIKWLHSSDPPLLKIGKVYTLTSHLDAWLMLSGYLSSHHLEIFSEICLKVFQEVHPKFELEPEKRFAASIYGKIAVYSDVLREGLATALVMLSLFTISSPDKGADFSARIVTEVLDSDNWMLWASVSDVLTELAEASPESFLDAVEKQVAEKPDLFRTLFAEESTGGIFGGGGYYYNLLWALESLAWSKLYLGRVTLILGALTELDPGGRTMNRPVNSLREIYLPWHPGTFVSPMERIQALKTLLSTHHQAGWKLLIALLSKVLDGAHPTHRFKWRSFGDDDPIVTTAQYYEYLSGIMDCIVNNIDTDNVSQKWLDIIPELEHFSDGHRGQLLGKLKQAVITGVVEDNRDALWEAMRTVINHHRNFPDARWAMSKREISKLEKVLPSLEPTSITDRYAWLFTNRWLYDFDDSSELDWTEKEAKRTNKRIAATREIVAELSETELYNYISTLERPDIIGLTLAEVFALDSRVEKTILNINIEPATESFLISFIGKSFFIGGWDWAEQMLSQARHWPKDKIALFFLGLPTNNETWKRLDSFSQDIHNIYWLKANLFLYHSTPEEVEFATKKLLDCGRVQSAFSCVAHYPKSKMLSGRVIKAILDEFLRNPKEEPTRGRIDQYEVENLFEILDLSNDVSPEEIAQLEFSYGTVLAGTKRQHRVLYGQIAKNPSLYTDLISTVYLPKHRTKSDNTEVDPQTQTLALTAFKILDNYNVLPGTIEDGTIHEETLLNWIKLVRQQCDALDRIEVADINIGHLLAREPRDPETFHPHETICNVIQKLQNDDIDHGFEIEILNSRGTVWKSVDEEGNEEKALASKYENLADKLALRWPRVSKIMKRLANNYVREAQRHQQDNELRQHRFN